MMKAMRALTRYAAAGIKDTGLGDSDFPVLEVLLHKGPLPVNTIGPIVDLTPGSISTAVDRLVTRGLVSRVESTEDAGTTFTLSFRRFYEIAKAPSREEAPLPAAGEGGREADGRGGAVGQGRS